MSNLDDRIRDSHQQILNVPPSETGWERLRQELGKTPARPSSPLGFLWGVALGFLAGAGCIFGSNALIEQAGAAPPPCPQIIAAATPAESTVPQIAAPVIASVHLVSPTDDISRVADLISASPPSRQLTVAATPREALTTPDEPKRAATIPTAVALLTPGTSFPPQRVHSRRINRLGIFDPFAFEVDAVLPSPEHKQSFWGIPSEQQPAPRWEIGGSVFALPTKQRYLAKAISTTPQPGDQAGFLASIDGQVDTFYQGSVTGMLRDRQLAGFRSAYLEVAHQFPNGIRLSGGLLGILHESSNYSRKADVFAALGRDNEFTEVYTSSARELYTGLAIQYTFFRRRRFRVSPGISLLGNWMSTNISTRFQYRGEGPVTGSQSTLSHDNALWSDVELLPSLQLQYQVGRHLSLTADCLPGLGVGLRYGIRQPSVDR